MLHFPGLCNPSLSKIVFNLGFCEWTKPLCKSKLWSSRVGLSDSSLFVSSISSSSLVSIVSGLSYKGNASISSPNIWLVFAIRNVERLTLVVSHKNGKKVVEDGALWNFHPRFFKRTKASGMFASSDAQFVKVQSWP